MKSRSPFVLAAWKLLNDLSELGIRLAQWTNFRWSTEYSKSTPILRVFIPRARTRPLVMGLLRTSWVKLNRLRTGVGRFHSAMHKGSLARTLNCKCGTNRKPRYFIEQTAVHAILACPIHRAPREVACLTVLDDDTRCGLDITTASI